MHKSQDCFFCKVSGELFLFENDYFYSMLDEYPVSPGHVLIVLKTHIASLRELPSAQGAAMMDIAQRTLSNLSVQTLREFYLNKATNSKDEKSKELCKAALDALDGYFDIEDFNLGINDGPAAGQTIPHLHIHVMPRFGNDGGAGIGGVQHIFSPKGDYKS